MLVQPTEMVSGSSDGLQPFYSPVSTPLKNASSLNGNFLVFASVLLVLGTWWLFWKYCWRTQRMEVLFSTGHN